MILLLSCYWSLLAVQHILHGDWPLLPTGSLGKETYKERHKCLDSRKVFTLFFTRVVMECRFLSLFSSVNGGLCEQLLHLISHNLMLSILLPLPTRALIIPAMPPPCFCCCSCIWMGSVSQRAHCLSLFYKAFRLSLFWSGERPPYGKCDTMCFRKRGGRCQPFFLQKK